MDKSNQIVSSEKRLDNEPNNDAEPPSAISPSRAPENQTSRFDIESILWIVVSGVVMYYTDFWNLVLHDARVKWLDILWCNICSKPPRQYLLRCRKRVGKR